MPPPIDTGDDAQQKKNGADAWIDQALTATPQQSQQTPKQATAPPAAPADKWIDDILKQTPAPQTPASAPQAAPKQLPAAPPQTAPSGKPVMEAQPEKGFWGSMFDSFRNKVANSAVGYAVEETLPKLADYLSLHPTETAANPEQEEHAGQLLAVGAGNEKPGFIKGVEEFAGSMTTPANIEMMFATGGLGELDAVLGKIGVTGFGKLLSAYFSAQMIKGAVDAYPAFKQAIENKQYDVATQIATESGLSLIMGALAFKHAAEGTESENTTEKYGGTLDRSKAAQNEIDEKRQHLSAVARATQEYDKIPKSDFTSVRKDKELSEVLADVSKTAGEKKAAEQQHSLEKLDDAIKESLARVREKPPYEEEGQPALLPPPQRQYVGASPVLEGSPQTAEQRFSDAEAAAWQEIHEGRAERAQQILVQMQGLAKDYEREEEMLRLAYGSQALELAGPTSERFAAQRAGELRRLADEADAEEERLSAQRGFRDIGRRAGEETAPVTPPPAAAMPASEVAPPPSATDAVPPPTDAAAFAANAVPTPPPELAPPLEREIDPHDHAGWAALYDHDASGGVVTDLLADVVGKEVGAKLTKRDVAIARGVADDLRAKAKEPIKYVHSLPQDMGSTTQVTTPRGNFSALWGTTDESVTPQNKRAKVQWAIVDAGALNTSFDSNFKQNEEFPESYQPRNRTRAASRDQFTALTSQGAGQLDYARMADNVNAGDGAPIVDSQLNALTRNMGSTALKYLYDADSPIASQYRQSLIDNAGNFGFDPSVLEGMKQPVLVRTLLTKMTPQEAARFAEEANTPTTAKMSATEQALVDAKKIDNNMAGLLQPTEDGSLNNVANAGFVRAFFENAVPPAERGAYMRADGSLSLEGVSRIRNAVFMRAYPGGEKVLEMMAESPDSNVKNVEGAMRAAAPKFAIMQSMIDRGELHDMGITKDIADAARKLSELRRSGQSPLDYLNTGSLGFGGEGVGDIDPTAKELLRAIVEKGRSVKGMTKILSDYADVAMRMGRTDQGNLLGITEGPSKDGILRVALQENKILDFGDEGPGPRVEVAPEPIPAPPPTSLDKTLTNKGEELYKWAETELKKPDLHPARREYLERMQEMYKDLALGRIPGQQGEPTVPTGPAGSRLIEAMENLKEAAETLKLNKEYEETKVGPPPEEAEKPPVRQEGIKITAPRERAEKLAATNRDLEQRLSENLTDEERGQLRDMIAQNQKLIEDFQSRDFQDNVGTFKASKKNSLALVTRDREGSEMIRQEFTSSFLKKNRDSLVDNVKKSSTYQRLVDSEGKVVAESAAGNVNATPEERMGAMTDADLQKTIDGLRAGGQGFEVHPYEDELARRRAIESPPQGFGKNNKIFTEDAKNEAMKRLLGRGMSANPFLDPELLKDMVSIGGYFFEGGARTFAEWSHQFATAAGEIIDKLIEPALRPAYLQETWSQIESAAKEKAAELTKGADDKTISEINEQLNMFKEVPRATERSNVGGKEPNVGVGIQERGKTEGVPVGGAGSEGGGRDVLRRPTSGNDAFGEQPGRKSRVPAPYLDRPARVRGESIVPLADWQKELESQGLPPNAPGPTVALSPEIHNYLKYGPQRAVARMAISELEHGSGAFVIATPTGTGKTVMGAAIVKEILDRNPGDNYISIVTKGNDLKEDWKNYLAGHGIEAKDFEPGLESPPGPGVYLSTYSTSIVRPGVENFPWNFSVFDESSEARRWYNSKQGIMAKKMGNSADKVLWLSATPFHNALELGYMDRLGLWRETGFEQWSKQMGVRMVDGKYYGGNSPRKLAMLRKQLIERGQFVSLDRDMSGYQTSFGMVPLTAEQHTNLANIRQAFQLAGRYFQQRGLAGLMRAATAAEVNYMKAYVDRSTLQPAIELGKKAADAGWKVTFYSDTKASREEVYDFLKDADKNMEGRIGQLLPNLPGVWEGLQGAFGNDIANYSGSASPMRRQELDDFNEGRKKHLFTTFQAGSMGVNMHDKVGDAPRMSVFIGVPWSGVIFDQGLGRLWRYGTKSDVNSIILATNSRAHYNTVIQRVGGRLESLHALVHGVEQGDPTVEGLKNIDAAIAYGLGGEEKLSGDDFIDTVDNPTGIIPYRNIQIPNADSAKNKGLRVQVHDVPPPPGMATMHFGGLDPEQIAKLGRDVASGVKRLGTKMKAAFDRADTPAPPPTGRPDMDDRVVQNAVGNPIAATVIARAFANAKERETFSDIASGIAEVEGTRAGLVPEPAMTNAWRNLVDSLHDVHATAGGAASLLRDMAIANGRQLVEYRGEAVGPQLAKTIPMYQQEQWVGGPWKLRALDVLNSLTDPKHDWDRLHLAVEGLVPPSDAKMAAAVEKVREINRERAQAANKAGVLTEIKDRATGKTKYAMFGEDANYMQRIYDPNIFKFGDAARERAVNGIMMRYAVDKAEAERMLDAMKGRDVPLAGTVERAREFDIPGYRTDFNAYLTGIDHTAEAIARTKVFGQYREKLSGLISQVEDPYSRKLITEVFDQILARTPLEGPVRDLLTLATNWTVTTKMATSAIPAMSHWLKPALFSNDMAFAKAVVKEVALSPRSAFRFATEANSLRTQINADMLREFGMQGSLAQKVLHYTGFTGVDTIGRVVASATAKVWMNDALSSLIKNPNGRSLLGTDYRRYLGDHFHISNDMIDEAVVNRAWSREALLRGAKSFSDMTQYTFDPSELPRVFRLDSTETGGQTAGALMRMSLMLKSYIWKNMYSLHDALWKEARKGNFAPWAPFLTYFPPAAMAISTVLAAAHGDKKKLAELMDSDTYAPGKLLKKVASDMATYTAANYVFSVIDSLQNPYGGDTIMNFGGPAASDAVALGHAIVASGKAILNNEPQKLGNLWRGTARKVFVPIRPFVSPPPRGRSGGGGRHSGGESPYGGGADQSPYGGGGNESPYGGSGEQSPY